MISDGNNKYDKFMNGFSIDAQTSSIIFKLQNVLNYDSNLRFQFVYSMLFIYIGWLQSSSLKRS